MNTKILLYAAGFCLLAMLAFFTFDPHSAMAATLPGLHAAAGIDPSVASGLAFGAIGLGIKELRDKKAALIKEAETLGAKVDAGEADEDETARLAAIMGDDDDPGELDTTIKAIAREERLMDARRTAPAVIDLNADTEDEAADKAPAQAKAEAERFGSIGEMLQAVAFAGRKGVTHDEWDRRLQGIYEPGGLHAASGASEAVPSEGGFLVQQDLAAPMYETMFETGAILPRVRRIPIGANSNGLKIPAIDETSRADGSRWGGVRAYWADEADTVTASKPKFRMMELSLKKLLAIAYATDELLRDATALGAVMSRAFTEEITFKAEDGIINGSGAGQPLGFLNSGALISVAKDSGQAADTISTANVLNMYSRLPPRSMTRAVWLINQNILPQLWQLTLGSGTAVVLLYTPPGVAGPNAGPAGNLLGRPVIPIEQAATLGDLGDILLVDLDQYLMIDKGGIEQASSMHVRFLYDEMTFRFSYRVDGQPLQRSATTPYKATGTTLSPYVALAAR